MSLNASPLNPPPARGLHTRVTVLIVGRAPLWVGQYLAGLLRLLETLLRLLVVRIAVGVILHGEAAIRLLDLCLGRILRYVEYLVVVTFGHALRESTPGNQAPRSSGRAYGDGKLNFPGSVQGSSPHEALRSLSLTSSNSASTTSSRPVLPAWLPAEPASAVPPAPAAPSACCDAYAR